MVTLTHSQWARINAMIFEIHAAGSEDDLISLVTEVLPTAIRDCYICWNEHDTNIQLQRVATTDSHREAVKDYLSALNETMGSHPTVLGLQLSDNQQLQNGVHSGTDFVSALEWKNRAIYQEAYRHLEAEHQLLAQIAFSPVHSATMTVNSGREFTEQQRAMVEILAQHLVLASRKHSIPVEARLKMFNLSPRLRSATGFLTRGIPRKEIADRMDISIHTLNDYVKEIYTRFEVHSQSELINRFIK